MTDNTKNITSIGFFGGSFSPPHYGHFLAACYALKRYNLNEVWFCPSFKHALGKESWNFDFRMQLCQALVLGFETQFKVSEVETSSETDGKTYNTLQLLQKKHPDYSFKLIVGSDILQQKDLWYRFSAIEDEFGLCLVPRERYSAEPLAIPNFSSTEIRKLLDLNDHEKLSALVPPQVLKLILNTKKG